MHTVCELAKPSRFRIPVNLLKISTRHWPVVHYDRLSFLEVDFICACLILKCNKIARLIR